LAWVTWRQHRLQLLTGLGVLVGVGVAAFAVGIPIQAAYHRQALSSCLPPATRSGCDLIVRHFQSEFAGTVRGARFLIALPALVGIFVGAPLLARELEQGTYRLAWTQGVTRRRWLISKTALLGLAAAAGGLALSGIVMWWRHPFDTVAGRMSPSGFEIEGVVVPAYTLFALALGVLAGALLRRTVPAMSVTLAAFFAVRLSVARFLRPHYLAPLQQKAAGVDPRARAHDWVLSNSLVDAVGRHISTPREDLAILHARQARIDPQDYLLSLGWRRVVSYHPADRFWLFQSIEAAIFVVLSVAIVGATIALVRRRPA
jgi:hypothetical protein